MPNATYEQLDRVADALIDLIEYVNTLEWGGHCLPSLLFLL
jgi:hypothetical protein